MENARVPLEKGGAGVFDCKNRHGDKRMDAGRMTCGASDGANPGNGAPPHPLGEGKRRQSGRRSRNGRWTGWQGQEDAMQIVDGTPYIEQVKRLLFEYTNALGRDLAFQHLEEELLDPTSKYTPPAGELLVACEKDTVWGMVAYHRHSVQRCEMKRLYVHPKRRGQHVGEKADCTNPKPCQESGLQRNRVGYAAIDEIRCVPISKIWVSSM